MRYTHRKIKAFTTLRFQGIPATDNRVFLRQTRTLAGVLILALAAILVAGLLLC